MYNLAGLNLHFIHERSRVPGAVPILLIHGWPGSIWEFHKLIPQLVQPTGRALRLKQAFHVVAPSLPGYGWSEECTTPGMNVTRMARMFNELMLKLGYEKYFVQGGDWGAVIAKSIAINFSDHCVALHLNMVVPRLPLDASFRSLAIASNMLLDFSPLGSLVMSERDKHSLDRFLDYTRHGSGYMAIQGSKPMSLGVGLADSPVGLLAWILEKLEAWSDGAGNVLNVLDKDEILTNVMIYYVTNSIASSMRLYYESAQNDKQGSRQLVSTYVEIPTAVASFPNEIIIFPRRWIALSYNLLHYNVFPEGGHFAAWEQPDLVAQDLRSFFFKTMPFEEACKLAQQRKLKRNMQPPVESLAASALLLAPALPMPFVIGMAAYLLSSKL